MTAKDLNKYSKRHLQVYARLLVLETLITKQAGYTRIFEATSATDPNKYPSRIYKDIQSYWCKRPYKVLKNRT